MEKKIKNFSFPTANEKILKELLLTIKMSLNKLVSMIAVSLIGIFGASSMILFKRVNNLEKDNIQLTNCMMVIGSRLSKLETTEYEIQSTNNDDFIE